MGEQAGNWRKSSFSANGGEQCVETANGNRMILVRDTTDRDGGTLAFTASAWSDFTSSLR
jgi:hypothetical protein